MIKCKKFYSDSDLVSFMNDNFIVKADIILLEKYVNYFLLIWESKTLG